MRKNRFFGLAAILLAFGLVVAACGDDDTAETTTTTATPAEEAPALVDIVDTAVSAGSFGTLATALTEAGLVDTLKGEGPFTVFAPTDEAFGAALEALGITAEELLADTETLTDILLYHVVPGAVFAEDVVQLESATTVQGSDISINVGDGVVLNDSVKVVQTDIEASNGVIHVIDFVLLPPADEAMDESMDESMDEALDIVDTAVSAGSFGTLATALTEAGLIDTLKGEGPFTVFAPTDEAFGAALEALGITAEELLADTETLTDILLYHVVPGAVFAEDVVQLESATTAQGSDISISVGDGVVLNDSVKVVQTDIETSNGVIHVIDFVLLPPSS